MTMPLIVLLAAQTFANATIVSTDVPGQKVTIKRNNGPSEVLVVEGAAAARLQELKAGDEVILTLRGADGAPQVVLTIEPSLRGTRPARRFKPGSGPVASPSPAATARPPRTRAVTPKASPSPSPGTGHLPTDTVGPLQDPRKGAQQDPRDNPNRDPRVVPGLSQPPPAAKDASPSPSPTPTPDA